MNMNWKLFINRKLNVKTTLPPLVNENDDSMCFTDQDKASLFNLNFRDVFIQDDGVLPDFVQKCYNPMPTFEITTSTTDVVLAIQKLKDKITRTPEGVPSYFIKRISFSIADLLTFIFNCSLHLNVVPFQWKYALVIPIYKKGNKSDPKNYRPISLTSSFSRVFEIILHDKISLHLTNNSLLSPHQFGFLQGLSSCVQLLTCIHEWLYSICSGSKVNIVYTDIKKAFDTVSHIKLFNVLLSYGISSNVCFWIYNFLSNRSQSVCVGSAVSSPLPILSGVPQGSVIGPLLFIIFFDDISNSVITDFGKSGIKLYADDAKLFDNDSLDLQSSLESFTSWLDEHQLQIAPSKCFSITLSKQNSTVTPPNFMINGNTLEIKSQIKDLGIIISHNLKWHDHISHIYKKASLCSYQIFKSFRTKNIWVLLKLYKVYIRSNLEYNTPVWSPYLQKDVDRIESVQRRFTRFAFRRCGLKFSSYEDRLRQLNLQPLELRRTHYDLSLLYKIINNQSCIKFSEYFIFQPTFYNLRRNSVQIQTKFRPKFNNKHWNNNFFIRSVKFWNSLPEHVVTAPNLDLFKKRLQNVVFA